MKSRGATSSSADEGSTFGWEEVCRVSKKTLTLLWRTTSTSPDRWRDQEEFGLAMLGLMASSLLKPHRLGVDFYNLAIDDWEVEIWQVNDGSLVDTDKWATRSLSFSDLAAIRSQIRFSDCHVPPFFGEGLEEGQEEPGDCEEPPPRRGRPAGLPRWAPRCPSASPRT